MTLRPKWQLSVRFRVLSPSPSEFHITDRSSPVLRLTTAEELHSVLRSPDPVLLLSVLQVIASDPRRAAAFGSHEGADTVGALLDLIERQQGGPIETAALVALGAFDDPRVEPVMRLCWQESAHPDSLAAAAYWTARAGSEALVEQVTAWLFEDGDAHRAGLAAVVAAARTDLAAAERLRVSLSRPDLELEPPPLTLATADHWALELAGPFRQQARAWLDARTGEATACARLLDAWADLARETQLWALSWGASACADAAWTLIASVLRNESDEALILAALRAAAGMARPKHGEDLGPLFAQAWRHPDPRIRLASIAAGLTGQDWARSASRDPDLRVRAAAIRRHASESDPADTALLLRFMEHESWQLRAAATEALKTLGEAGADAAEPLLMKERQEVRLAAIQVLMAVGRHDYVEDAVLTP